MKPDQIFLFYVLLINLTGFFSMGIDKRKAQKSKWRIPERTLFLIALLGGAFGSLLGMHLFHHKTRHWYFRYGFPAICILQLILYVIFCTPWGRSLPFL